jgi:hypothetical protein
LAAVVLLKVILLKAVLLKAALARRIAAVLATLSALLGGG